MVNDSVSLARLTLRFFFLIHRPLSFLRR